MPLLSIRHTLESDLSDIDRIFNEARRRMRSCGNMSQWVNGYPNAECVRRDMDRNCSFVATDDTGKVVGTFAFIIGPDPTYANIYPYELYGLRRDAWLSSLPYGTIHRIAAADGVHGIVRNCVQWAEAQVPSIRIDTHVDNRPMLHILKGLGFSFCGMILLRDGSERVAFERISDR